MSVTPGIIPTDDWMLQISSQLAPKAFSQHPLMVISKTTPLVLRNTLAARVMSELLNLTAPTIPMLFEEQPGGNIMLAWTDKPLVIENLSSFSPVK